MGPLGYNTISTIRGGQLTFWYNTRVHESGQSEVGEDEEGDDSLVRRHPWVSQYVILGPAKRERTVQIWLGITQQPGYSREVEEECRSAEEQCPSKCRRYIPRFHIALWHNVR